MITIEKHDRGCGAACAELLSELPEWFGLPESNAAYARTAEEGPAWLAMHGGTPVGVMLLKRHAEALEIWLMAVRRGLRGQGVGTVLMATAEAETLRLGMPFLTVKTLGPSMPDENYAATRAFYRARGFAALEEFTEIWGPENPALMMAKTVQA